MTAATCMLEATPDIEGKITPSPDQTRPKIFYTEDEYRHLPSEKTETTRTLWYTSNVSPVVVGGRPEDANYDDLMQDGHSHDFSKLPAMTYRQCDEVIADLWARLAKEEPGEQVALIKAAVSKDYRLQRRFMLSFDEGHHLEHAVLHEFAEIAFIASMPTSWMAPEAFDDDTNFSIDRFYLTVRAFRKLHSIGAETLQHAVAQAKRLLMAGLIDYEDVEPIAWVTDEGSGERLDSLLRAYDPEWEQKAAQLMQLINARRGQMNAAGIDFALRQLETVEVERERLLREVWLPGMIEPAEWAVVSGMHISFLVDMYPHLVEKGYAGYREAIKQRLAA